MADDLAEKTARIERTHATGQYSEAWKVVNEIRGQIAGSGPEECVSNWFDHFNNLLGSSRDTANTERDISEILCDLDINDGPFSTKEYKQARNP